MADFDMSLIDMEEGLGKALKEQKDSRPLESGLLSFSLGKVGARLLWWRNIMMRGCG
jgi:hypothetical protein